VVFIHYLILFLLYWYCCRSV